MPSIFPFPLLQGNSNTNTTFFFSGSDFLTLPGPPFSPAEPVNFTSVRVTVTQNNLCFVYMLISVPQDLQLLESKDILFLNLY